MNSIKGLHLLNYCVGTIKLFVSAKYCYDQTLAAKLEKCAKTHYIEAAKHLQAAADCHQDHLYYI